MKHATKDMAITAKSILEKQFEPKPKWLKSVEIDFDDHGYFLTTKVHRQDYVSYSLPSTIDVNGFKLKNCVLLLG